MSISRLAWNICESCFQNKLIKNKKIDDNKPQVYSLLLQSNPFVHYVYALLSLGIKSLLAICQAKSIGRLNKLRIQRERRVESESPEEMQRSKMNVSC